MHSLSVSVCPCLNEAVRVLMLSVWAYFIVLLCCHVGSFLVTEDIQQVFQVEAAAP